MPVFASLHLTWIEFYDSTRFFTANDEFQGSSRLTQHPLLTLVRFGSVAITLRYEMTASTPDGPPTNALVGIRVATVPFQTR